MTPTDLTNAEWESDVRVRIKEQVAQGVVLLELEPTGDAGLPAWQPGAHIDLLLPNGLVRQYSLCGSTDDRSCWRVAVLQEEEGGGGSDYVHRTLRQEETVRVRGPRNHFALEPAQRYLFIAGGIGITPLMPMIAQAERAGSAWTLAYGGRSRSSMAFLDELGAHGDKVRVFPQDEVGLIDLDGLLGEPDDQTLVYSCGPEPLLAAVEERCSGWPLGALHVERFQPKELDSSGLESEFDVVLARSGLTVHVTPGTSVLSAVEQAGVEVLNSCREGTCGTCETTVLEGSPLHRDSILTETERASGEFMMICVSRCDGDRLVLDL